MAIDRFQNKDLLVSGKVPVERVQVYDLADHANLEKSDLYLNVVEVLRIIYRTGFYKLKQRQVSY